MSEVKINAVFKEATAYDIQMLEVDKGEKFSLALSHHHHTHPSHWYSDNDEVLEVKVAHDGNSAQIQALQEGRSEILIRHQAGERRFHIKVRKPATPEAVSLGLSFGKPVNK